MLDGLLKAILEVGVRSETLVAEFGDLALEVGLASEGDLLAFILSDQGQGRLACFVASESKTVPDKHLFDKVVLSVLDNSQSHDMEEGVSIGVWHHRVGTGCADKFLKAVTVELGCCDVDRRLAVAIANKRTSIAMLEQCIDHEGVAT